jgi:hypothetical protein
MDSHGRLNPEWLLEKMADTVLSQCDPILTQTDAEAPVLSAILPVKGLRRDLSGNLTKDSIVTVTEGIKSLGVIITSNTAKVAILQEARLALCKLNAQFEFILNDLVTKISRSEISAIDPALFDLIKSKNQDMQDVLAVSRHVIEIPIEGMSEGFLGTQVDPLVSFKEAFQEMEDTVSSNSAMIRTGRYEVSRLKRTLDVSREKNLYAERLTNMYGLLNVTAIGLLFYIMFTN